MVPPKTRSPSPPGGAPRRGRARASARERFSRQSTRGAPQPLRSARPVAHQTTPRGARPRCRRVPPEARGPSATLRGFLCYGCPRSTPHSQHLHTSFTAAVIDLPPQPRTAPFPLLVPCLRQPPNTSGTDGLPELRATVLVSKARQFRARSRTPNTQRKPENRSSLVTSSADRRGSNPDGRQVCIAAAHCLDPTTAGLLTRAGSPLPTCRLQGNNSRNMRDRSLQSVIHSHFARAFSHVTTISSR